MKSSQFAEAYEHQHAWEKRDTHPLRNEVLTDGAEWSKHFSDLLLYRLRGGMLTHDEADQALRGYQYWLQTDFSRAIFKQDLFDDEPDEHIIEQFYDEVMFHATNYSVSGIWQKLLTGETIQRNQIEKTQIDLACMSISQAHPVARKHKAGELYGRDGNKYFIQDSDDKRLMGLATQFDAAVAYLELMKDTPGLVVVPAPPQFERGTSNIELNTDFVAIDTNTDNAHGIQVKMNARNSKRRHEKYNEEYVTVLDGMNDLKNFVFMRRPGTSDSIAVPMPGLYSAHFLTAKKGLFRFGHKKGTNVIQHRSTHDLVAIRQRAFDLTDLAPSANTHVNQRLSQVALECLARE